MSTGPWKRKWTAEKIIEAIQRWVRVKGEIPRTLDWMTTFEGFPHSKTVTDMFGTWNEAIKAAGFEPRPRRGNKTAH